MTRNPQARRHLSMLGQSTLRQALTELELRETENARGTLMKKHKAQESPAAIELDNSCEKLCSTKYDLS